MSKVVDYFYTPASPWTYLGHQRLEAMALRHGASIQYKPVDYGKIFPLSGGLPLGKRAPQRQAYRLAELKRWRDFLGVPLTIQPKYHPVASDLAAQLIIAADPGRRGGGAGPRRSEARRDRAQAGDRSALRGAHARGDRPPSVRCAFLHL